jgi:chaperone required for assembly of F1-ATPase
MSGGWTLKRFWKDVAVTKQADGYGVALDGRPVRTPGKTPLILPTRLLAEWVAQEWEAQAEKIDPMGMPATRTANSAIDKVTPQKAEVAAMLAAYGGSDLLCYRADGPVELVTRQTDEWNPLLDWAAERYDARLIVTTGVMPVAQDSAALVRLAAEVGSQDVFRLAAFHDLVALSGSLILALAVCEGRLDPETAWSLSRIDEDWQAQQWGRDDEAEAAAAIKMAAFAHAARFHALCG